MTKIKCLDCKCVDSYMEIIAKQFLTFHNEKDFQDNEKEFQPNEKDLKIDLLGCLNCGKISLFSSPGNIKEYIERKKNND